MSTCLCPFQETIDLLSKRHVLTILWLLQQESPRRFTDFRNDLQINPVTLTQRLGELEEAGILTRTAFRESPPRVDYALTKKGDDLLPLMDALCAWARKHAPAEAHEATAEARS